MPLKYTPIALAVSYALFATSTWAVEQDSNINVTPTQMITIYANAEENKNDVGRQHYGKEQLENTPNSQKTITDFLKVNPNVQFGNETMSGGTQANLNASDVSINGALFYENKFLLNNVDIGNSLNPASGNNDAGFTAIAGNSLSATLNMDLICDLEVLDSNVSAEYGGFTGGVVKAKTCAPKTEVGKIHGSISYDFTSSAWMKQNYASDEEQESFEEATDDEYQKDFTKQGVSATIYGKATEKLGLSLSASHRWSEIDMKSGTAIEQDMDQKRQSDNFSGNAYYDVNENNKLKFGLYYQEDDNKKYVSNLLNSNYQSQGENVALDAEWETRLKHAKVTQNIVVQKKTQSKDSLNNVQSSWNKSTDKNWGNSNVSAEGGYGDLETSQNNWQYDLKSAFDDIQWLGLKHQFKVGAGYAHAEADWKREGEVSSYYLPTKSLGGLGISSCTRDDGSVDALCDLTYVNGTVKGQYLNKRYVYQAGEIDVQQDRWYAFVEDEMNWNDTLKMRLGLRQDYDSLSKKNNFSPRTNFEYQPFANESLKLLAGWNRYYANNAFVYELQDGVNALVMEQKRSSINSDWVTSNANVSTSNTQRNDLDSPFADESVFAVQGNWKNWTGQLKYVHRDNQDQIRKKYLTTSAPLITEYDNDGESKADTYTLSLSNLAPFEWYGTQNQFRFAVDYTDITRNFNDYDDNTVNSLNYQPYVVYNGKIIAEGDRPATNFAQPWTVRVGWDLAFEAIPLKVSNLFRYRSPYEAAVRSTIASGSRPLNPLGDEIKNSYEETKLGSRFNWDIRTSYDIPFSNQTKLIFGLTVNNVTNKKNKYTVNSANSNDNTGKLRSELGRQFIADVTYKF